jgi:hypothetical protein
MAVLGSNFLNHSDDLFFKRNNTDLLRISNNISTSATDGATSGIRNLGTRTAYSKDGAGFHWFLTNDTTNEPNANGYGFFSNGSAVTEHRFLVSGVSACTINSNGILGYGGGLNNLSVFATAGGNEANLSTSFENRLGVNFTATGPRVVMIGHISIASNTNAANDFFLRLVIRDTVTNTDVGASERIGSSAWALSGASTITGSVVLGNLTIGRVYNARLDIRKTQNQSSFFPIFMRIDGIVY